MFCSNCGAKIEDGHKFCSECGEAVINLNEFSESDNSVVADATPDLTDETLMENEAESLEVNEPDTSSEPDESENDLSEKVDDNLNSADDNSDMQANDQQNDSSNDDDYEDHENADDLDEGSDDDFDDTDTKEGFIERITDWFWFLDTKKKILIIAVAVILLLFVVKGCSSRSKGSDTNSESSTTVNVIKYQLYLDIESSTNLIFSTYDVEIYLDNAKLGNISNGKNYTALREVEEGNHVINFYKNGEHSVSAREVINVNSDCTYKCTLNSKSDSIIVNNVEILHSIDGTSIVVDNVSNMKLPEAIKLLEGKGFINVNYEGEDGEVIFDESDWVVISQSVEPGLEVDQNAEIVLVCKKTDVFLDNNFDGLNIIEAQAKVEGLGYTATYLNGLSKDDMSEKIKKMSDDEKKLWIVSDSSEDSTVDNFIKIYFIYTGEVKVPNVTGMNLSEALKKLKSLEFSEIQYTSNNSKTIWNTNNWEVISQSVSSGEKLKANEQIVLTCKSSTATTAKSENSDENEKTTKKPETTKDSIPLGKKNALKTAENYLSFSAFSKKGLIDQLEFEGYTSEEAKYAADNCGANWNEQAAKKAQSYLDFTSFSKQGLIEQLEFEGFTHDQAVYGAKAVGY